MQGKPKRGERKRGRGEGAFLITEKRILGKHNPADFRKKEIGH